MSNSRDQRPLVIQKIKLRWWGLTFVPIALAFYLAGQGLLPDAFIMLAVFCTVFWLISFSVAVVILLLNRQPKAPRQ